MAIRLAEAIRRADGIIISSAGYHGTMSGLIKNALDFVEVLRNDDCPYFTGRPIGLVATAFGWQAAASTLAALRTTTHALRGWPTPYGASVNSAEVAFVDGSCSSAAVLTQLHTVADEVVDFATAAVVRPKHQAAAG